MTRLVSVYTYRGPGDVPPEPETWLDTLQGPSIFVREGRDGTRRRAVAGMLHGNEPSGFRAIHRALSDPRPPAVETVYFVGAVEAARTPPRHSHRMLPGRQDLNRSFHPGTHGLDARIASEALAVLTGRPLEAALDLHNNSGKNPAYGVGLQATADRLALSSYFSQLFVHARWNFGTLMEALDQLCPTVTIECGKAGDFQADDVAWQGLQRFVLAEHLPERVPDGFVPRVLSDPVRVTLQPKLTLAFADEPVDADLVVDRDVDRHNFQSLPAGTRLGWVRRAGALPVLAQDASGTDLAWALFEIRDGTLLTRVALTPIMMTTIPAIARSDCLFYAIRD